MGYNYFKTSLFPTEALEGFDKALASFFDGKKFFNDKYTYRKEKLNVSAFALKNFIFQKSSGSIDFFQKYNNVILSILTTDEINCVCGELGISDSPKHKSKDSIDEDIDGIKEEFKHIITNKDYKYSTIKNLILKDLFGQTDKDEVSFDLNIGIAGTLDSYFHTIIYPPKYSTIRFSKILNYYWACYFSIILDVIKFLITAGQKGFEEYITKEKTLDYKRVLNNMDKLTKELYKVDICNIAPKNSYYQIIHQMLKEHQNEIQCIGVITTNYYRFCEIVSSNTIYLNGQLKLFEYPELLEVVDMSHKSGYKDKILFPFIFGQSLVKPIVSSIQTEEFHRLNKLLNGNNSADILVILGFNINEDDNHINTFLHNFVKSGKKLIIVTEKEPFNIERKLRCSKSEVFVCKVNYKDNKKVIKKIFNMIMDN
ncbi:MAG: hypothetical protein IJJ40_07170 [Clostridia bacterium]|nr:hypothetical protein [Clostridia bacterium]